MANKTGIAAPFARQDHPARPKKPHHTIPFKGEDNTAWVAWHDQCKACHHVSEDRGCLRWGVTVHGNGAERGMPTIAGGCSAWRPKD